MKQVQTKIFTRPKLEADLKNFRDKSQKIVFTNGCFDLLHFGHMDYLSKAKKLGDKLIIGLNTDASVQLIKGPSRPVKDQFSRAHILASMEFVDAVILFDQETPLDLITWIMPDVLVKGGDYKLEDIVGHQLVLENGGTVQTIDFVEGFSSSKLIAKILKG